MDYDSYTSQHILERLSATLVRHQWFRETPPEAVDKTLREGYQKACKRLSGRIRQWVEPLVEQELVQLGSKTSTLRDRLVEPTPPRRVKTYKIDTPILTMPRTVVELQPVGYENAARRHGADGAVRMVFRSAARADSGIAVELEAVTFWLYEDEWYADARRLDEKRFLALLMEWHKPAFCAGRPFLV